MITLKYLANIFIIKCRLLLIWIFLPTLCLAQVVNGSFEINEQPTLDHWVISCNDGESFQDAPPGGGTWCLRVPEGNYQGCFPEIANQGISEFSNGDIWQVSVWARQYEKKFSPTSLYLKVFHASKSSTILSIDTTTSNEWTLLTVVDTLLLEEGDSVAIILDAGLTSGPQLVESYSYFDLVTAKKKGNIIVSADDFGNLHPKDFKLFQNFPNPFNPTTEISFSLPVRSDVSLKVFNLTGEEVTVLAKERLDKGIHQISFDAKGLPSGIYLYQLTAGSFRDTRKMVLLR